MYYFFSWSLVDLILRVHFFCLYTIYQNKMLTNTLYPYIPNKAIYETSLYSLLPSSLCNFFLHHFFFILSTTIRQVTELSYAGLSIDSFFSKYTNKFPKRYNCLHAIDRGLNIAGQERGKQDPQCIKCPLPYVTFIYGALIQACMFDLVAHQVLHTCTDQRP